MSHDPTIFSRTEAGLMKSGTNGVDSYRFGQLGPIQHFTFHHTDGARAKTNEQARSLNRGIQQYHMSKGWGDFAYHFSMDDHGRIYHGRPLSAKGSHVGGHNSNNVGFVIHGRYDTDQLTDNQNDTLRWLFRGGFYKLLGIPERRLDIKTHGEWGGTGCPGKNLQRHIRYLRENEL